ncbi:PDZ and LIM domain protein 1-like [Crassostrea virginica]|uniref:PDZ and LIM domain protein 1-like n=1 Tax=Crassostrea virginica TaxID=6565 RepID=A0A8B8D5X0_CRAVI|nr:PDZ and LIM domain protein 1-like [Crassostrea virginica]
MATMNIQLSKQNVGEPWGFRLQGGQDFRQQLQIKKVQPNSPCAGRLSPGDAVVGINNYSAQQLTHAQAQNLIRQSGNNLQLTVLRNQGSGLERIDSLKPKGPVKFSPWRQQ